ncbi:MAG TPA: 2-oxo acid dehydrogenase subunit E2 [Candidatus Aminicenantes bacterium]|nr:2-oxo acid dehydrogenase subunit E2 [Candidatus Aminicenantes bacterium]
MGKQFEIRPFPRTRLATFDIGALSRKKHYVTALLELDVSEARRKIRDKKKAGAKVSFTGWLLQAIAAAVARNKEAAAFRVGRCKLMIFNDVDVSLIVEKEVNGQRVPLPLLIRRADSKTPEEITAEIDRAKAGRLDGEQMVLERGMTAAEKLYYFLPGAVRRLVWRLMMRRPRYLFKKMGSVVVTAVGMMGQVNGWFVQTSVHPLSFGIGSILKKAVVKGDEVVVAEMLHLTVLVDHDAVDGAPMARFVAALTENVEEAAGL